VVEIVELVLLHYVGWNGFDRDATVLVAIPWREVEILASTVIHLASLVDTTLFKRQLTAVMSAVGVLSPCLCSLCGRRRR
jgi:hypothetical protein